MKIDREFKTVTNAAVLRSLCKEEFQFFKLHRSELKVGVHYNKMKELVPNFECTDLDDYVQVSEYLGKLKIFKTVQCGSESKIEIDSNIFAENKTGQLLLLILLCMIIELFEHTKITSFANDVVTQAIPLLIEINSSTDKKFEKLLFSQNNFLLKTLREFDFHLLDKLEELPNSPSTKPFSVLAANAQERQIVINRLVEIAGLSIWKTATGFKGFFRKLVSNEPEVITAIKNIALCTPNPTIEQLCVCIAQFNIPGSNQTLKAYTKLVLDINDLMHSDTKYNHLAHLINGFLNRQKITDISKLSIKPEQFYTGSSPIDTATHAKARVVIGEDDMTTVKALI